MQECGDEVEDWRSHYISDPVLVQYNKIPGLHQDPYIFVVMTIK